MPTTGRSSRAARRGCRRNGVAVGEDAPVGGRQPVAATDGSAAIPTTGALSGQAAGRSAERLAAEGEHPAVGSRHQVPAGGRRGRAAGGQRGAGAGGGPAGPAKALTPWVVPTSSSPSAADGEANVGTGRRPWPRVWLDPAGGGVEVGHRRRVVWRRPQAMPSTRIGAAVGARRAWRRRCRCRRSTRWMPPPGTARRWCWWRRHRPGRRRGRCRRRRGWWPPARGRAVAGRNRCRSCRRRRRRRRAAAPGCRWPGRRHRSAAVSWKRARGARSGDSLTDALGVGRRWAAGVGVAGGDVQVPVAGDRRRRRRPPTRRRPGRRARRRRPPRCAARPRRRRPASPW